MVANHKKIEHWFPALIVHKKGARGFWVNFIAKVAEEKLCLVTTHFGSKMIKNVLPKDSNSFLEKLKGLFELAVLNNGF